MVDGTPLLDIKPYVPAFDEREGVRIGWYTDRLEGLAKARADDRFGERGYLRTVRPRRGVDRQAGSLRT